MQEAKMIGRRKKRLPKKKKTKKMSAISNSIMQYYQHEHKFTSHASFGLGIVTISFRFLLLCPLHQDMK